MLRHEELGPRLHAVSMLTDGLKASTLMDPLLRKKTVFCLCLLSVLIGASLIAALLCPNAAHAQTQAKAVAKAVSVQGTVEARRAGTTAWTPVKLNDTFVAGDTIRVGQRSRADLGMLDQSVLRLNANTEITVEAVKDESTGVVNMLRGAAHFFSRGPRSLEVQTPFTIAGVRGTEFLVDVEPDKTLLTVFEGTVLAENPAGTLMLTSAQSAVAERGKPPVSRVVARPRDAVHWALHYPPVLYFRPDEFPAGPIRQSVEQYQKGDLQKAFDSIATVPQTVSDPRFFAYRAHLLLAVGRTDEANADIGRALQLAPNDPNALALQTITAVVQGDRDKALDSAQRAVQGAPSSATAQIALSYAQQARFDLEGARASLQKAVQLDPQNALAWARLSELQASFGELDRALEAAQKAAALEPNLSRTQTVLGYAHLMRINTKEAKAAFEKAIGLDSADPLPRLGLGLAKIREGNLQEGSREIEAAASLDPNNAIIRSYLGKAYYEEKRKELDEREYAVAKQLDPHDPTSYFYDAIAKQTTNRPVEALQDMQRAIELNDNRAVYRSRLLLDSDEAARSAAQGRIYTDLGFQPLALVEGWKSVNTDPTNFSAHRLLADTYATLPRHEVARVSELLQSQLLQPLTNTPIQPRLGESNLGLISAGGPGSLSFNEFNPIFNRDGVTLQATGVAGENKTWAGETVIGGIYRKVSVSLGYTYFETDGWRENADQHDRIANALVQLELTPRTTLQAEYRYRNEEHGDLQQRFFPDAFLPGLKNEQDTNTFRLGGRHAFSPGSIFLASLSYQKSDTKVRTDEFAGPGTFIDSKLPEKAYGAELQHLFRSQYLNLTTGVGYFNVDGEIQSSLGLAGLVLDLPDIDTKFDHVNVYTYANVNLLKNLTGTVGISYDNLSGDLPGSGESQVNPQVGITWNPFPATTVRAAAFRTLKRTLVTDQTLEPTQVAGFNQFFDDINLTDAWRYGGAVDQKFGKSVFGGVEFSKRDMTVPFIDLNSETQEADWDEYLGRAYLFWTPHRWLALRGQYIFERFWRSDRLTLGFKELDTHRVPLGFNFSHPSGLGASLTATYWNQEGRFEDLQTAEFRAGRDDFWLFDTAISYRLPKRLGFITVGATNLLNTNFKYYEVDFDNPTIQPDRMAFVRFTVALP